MNYIVSFFFAFYLLVNSIIGQTKLSNTVFDLGEIELLNADVVDFQLNNLSANSVYILRIESSPEVKIKYTSKKINPSATETLRIKLNPNKKGKLKKTIKLYLSTNTSPIEVSISAFVKAIPKNNLQVCPSFSSNTARTALNQKQKVAPIKQIPIRLLDHDAELPLLANQTTTEPGKHTDQPEQDQRSRKPIKPKKTRRSPEERRNSPSLGTLLFGKQETKKDSANQQATAELPKKEEQAETPAKEEVSLTPKNNNLLSDNYKPNNIIFLIDASTSMREEEKMDLLKKAMIELLAPLRSQDYLSIVTYSGEAQVVLNPTSAIEKDKIKNTINTISADGSTQAVKGIKKAIQVGKSNFIEGGNNQIILATDGAFDIGAKNTSLRKKIKATAKDGLNISVIGIKNAKWTNKSLKEIVELGEGDLIKINSERDALKVLEEVKKKSVY